VEADEEVLRPRLPLGRVAELRMAGTDDELDYEDGEESGHDRDGEVAQAPGPRSVPAARVPAGILASALLPAPAGAPADPRRQSASLKTWAWKT
jgi:hypothetical protein